MARQGKLHSSPWHVETSQYKWAIEHEERTPRRNTIDCPYVRHGGNICGRFEGNKNACRYYKCSYYKSLHDPVQSKPQTRFVNTKKKPPTVIKIEEAIKSRDRIILDCKEQLQQTSNEDEKLELQARIKKLKRRNKKDRKNIKAIMGKLVD